MTRRSAATGVTRVAPRVVLGAVIGVLLAGSLAGCSLPGGGDSGPAAPGGVGLESLSTPGVVDLGVVVSIGSAPGEGSEWLAAAEGAQVAAYRLADSGTRVRLHPVDDRGTVDGGAAAVQQLVDDHDVSGIVLATAGTHVTGALDAAADAGVPVVAPYVATLTEADGSDGDASGPWLTGPSQQALDAALGQALRDRQLGRVALVSAGAEAPAGLAPVQTVTLDPTRPRRAAREVARLADEGVVDAVVVAGTAQSQASVVRLLQGVRLQLPVLLTADALSPQFATALLEQDGTVEGDLTTAGIPTDDPGALAAGVDGSALSDWLAGVRAASDDPEATGLVDPRPFAEVAAEADTRSHDAVVALVAATAKARSTDPDDVAAALATLVLDHDQGLAGPALDLTQTEALDAASVTPLQATTDDPGLRGAGSAVRPLSWFALPTA